MFMANLSIISRYSRTFFERRLSEINIGFTDQMIMMYLCECNMVNQESIAKHFMLDKGAIAKALTKLEDNNYITREDNPNNKREKLISITDKGKNMIGYITNELNEWHSYLFRGLSQAEIDQFNNIVGKIALNAADVINEKKNSCKSIENSTLMKLEV